jgi:Tfp pilus assembly major pilin PilA
MRTLARLLLVSAVALAGCSGRDGADSANVTRWDGEMPIQGPWVRDRLPRGTQFYQRIPHPFGLIATPKGNMLDAALASEANVRNLMAIQEGLVTSLTADSGILTDPRARLLIEHLRSPVEVAAAVVPIPAVLCGMTLNLRSNAEVEALFAALAQFPPMPGLAGPLDDQGYGELAGLPMPVYVNFDARTGRLALFGGATVERSTFEGLLSASGENLDHPMAELEAQIDESGQGLFSWLDTSQLVALGGMALPPEVDAILRTSGIQELRSLGFGVGVAEGKGRLKLVADVGTLSANRPFPVIRNDIAATSVGDPRSLFLLSIPDPAEFRRLEALALAYLPPDAVMGWNSVKSTITENLGVSIEEILEAIGPELIAFSDRAGQLTGLKVRDSTRLNDVLSRLAAKGGTPVEERRVEGQTIHTAVLPGMAGLYADSLADDTSHWLRMLSRIQSRSYWVEEDGYLYIAGLPQVLIDRARLEPDTNIGEWVGSTQRLDLSSSLLAATGTVANLPRKTYEAYLGMMQGLADAVGAEHDIWSMPTALDLGLPERGSLGFSLCLGAPFISAELSYESHPLEIFAGGGGTSAVAVAGVLAAIAIPAYQDYTIRSQVAEGMNLAAAAKAAVAESYLARGVAPANRAAAGMSADAADTQGLYVDSLDIVDGIVVLTYGASAHASIAGRTLALRPYVSADGSVVWACGRAQLPFAGLTALGESNAATVTTIAPQYLPSACR